MLTRTLPPHWLQAHFFACPPFEPFNMTSLPRIAGTHSYALEQLLRAVPCAPAWLELLELGGEVDTSPPAVALEVGCWQLESTGVAVAGGCGDCWQLEVDTSPPALVALEVNFGLLTTNILILLHNDVV